MNRKFLRFFAFLLITSLVADPRLAVAGSAQRSSTGQPSVNSNFDRQYFDEQALGPAADWFLRFLLDRWYNSEPRIIRLKILPSPPDVPDLKVPARQDPDIDAPLLRAFSRVLGRYLCKGFGHTGGMISLDGPTGYGKTTFAGMLEREIQQNGFTGNVVALLLDDFHKPDVWRYAMAKLSVSETLTAEEEAVLTEEDRALATGNEFALIEERFYQLDVIKHRLQQIREILNSPPAEHRQMTFTVDAYDRQGEHTHAKSYTIRQGDIVVVEGKFANREELMPLYDFKSRFNARKELMKTRYEARARALNPAKIGLRLKFYDAVVWPSWEVYENRTHSQIDLVMDLEDRYQAFQDAEINVLEALKESPLTGKELMKRLPDIPADLLWQVVMLSEHIQSEFAGVHYPRIAQKGAIPPSSTMSPSPMREFYNFTAISSAGDQKITEKVEALTRLRKQLSARRTQQAKTIVYELAHRFAGMKYAIIISGDVSKEMAHSEKRHNLGSGHVMEGSDFDFIVLTDAGATEEDIMRIQAAFMIAPDIMASQGIEVVEADCDVFRVSQLARLNPDNSSDIMDAKNILQGELIFGDPNLLEQAHAALHGSPVVGGLETVMDKAQRTREFRKIKLLSTNAANWTSDDIEFFMGTFESFADVGKLFSAHVEMPETQSQEPPLRNGGILGLTAVLFAFRVAGGLASYPLTPARVLSVILFIILMISLGSMDQIVNEVTDYLWLSDYFPSAARSPLPASLMDRAA